MFRLDRVRRRRHRASHVTVLTLLIAALWFRLAVSVPPLNELTVGSLWRYDYQAAVNAAAGFGFVHRAPPDRLDLNPANAPIALNEIARTFEPLRLEEPPYRTTFRMPGYALASALAMWATGTTSIAPLIDLQLVLDSLVPLFTLLILLRLTNRACALVGAVLSVFWLPEAASASIYYGTAPVPFLLILSLWLYVEAVHRGSVPHMALFGGVWVAIAFLRLELIFIPLLLALLALVLPLGTHRRLRFALAPLIVLTAGLGAYTARNFVTMGELSLTSQPGGTMWEGMRYGSGLFPEYQQLSSDSALAPLLKSRGIALTPAAGTFFDGPQGMEANRALLGLLWTEVVRERPLDLVLHLASKLITNFYLVRNWQSALSEFGYEGRPRLAVAASCIDLLVHVVPWLAVVLIAWRNPRERILAVPLFCLIGLHLALMLTGAGSLRYMLTISPTYPLLIAVVLWLVAGRGLSGQPRREVPPSRLPVIMVVAVVAIFLVWRSESWPRAAGSERLLDVRLMPVQTAAHTALSTAGLTLGPGPSIPSDVNIAAQRPALFSTPPYYPGITGPDDATQLTDGVIEMRGNYQSPSWVGWGMQAPIVLVRVPLARSSFVSQIRIHALHGAFPLAGVRLWEEHAGLRRLVAAITPPPAAERTAWLTVPVNQRLERPIIELQPTPISDGYIFIDEIEILGGDVFAEMGEFVSAPIRLLGRTTGVPKLAGETPAQTSTTLWYRRAGTDAWHHTGWDASYLDAPVQFRILLYASPDRRRTPSVTHIRMAQP